VEVSTILEGCHADVYIDGHFVNHAIGCKVLLAKYWWPNLFKDALN
jgi:hypothetical protein